MSIVGADSTFSIPLYWASFTAAPQPLSVAGLPSGSKTVAYGINASGAIVGFTVDDDNIQNSSLPVYWASFTAAPQVLSLLSGNETGASGINASGAIVGYSLNALGKEIPVYWASFTAVPQLLSVAGLPNNVETVATGINASGAIVGVIENALGIRIPVYWASFTAVPQLLSVAGLLSGTETTATGINASGAIVGYSQNALSVAIPVYWASFTATPQLLSVAGLPMGSSRAYGINASGVIVGSIEGNVLVPVYWSSFTATPQLLSTTGFSGAFASGINDPPTPPISNICFPAGTPVQTDQGIVSIELLDTRTHTINKNPIVHVTRTTTLDKYLISFNQHALGRNMPRTTTLMTWDHKIMFEGQLVPAFRFLDYSDQVKKVKYSGETLYNVLLAGYGTMNINNLVCETLHPENIIAKLYSTNYTVPEQQTLVYQLNTSLKNKDIKGYKEVVDKLTAKK